MANNVAEEIFKIKADTADIIAGLQKLKGVYVELTEEQKKQAIELATLEQKEKSLTAARNKSTNPTTTIQLTKAISENKKQVDALKASVDKYTMANSAAKVEVDSLSKSVSNAFKSTAVNAAITDMKKIENAAISAKASGFSPLNNSVNQLSRELPAFAVSANVGFLAISNNLPIFFDALQRINKENAELAKGGKKTTGVLAQLGQAVFSMGTLLSVAVTLLTLYGGAIAKAVSSLFDQRNELELNKEALADYNDEIEASEKNQKKFTDRITATALELIKLTSGLGAVQANNLEALSKVQDEFTDIEKRRRAAVTKMVMDQLKDGDNELKIATEVKDGLIAIKNEETGEIIKLDKDMKNIVGSTFFGKEALTRNEKALRDKIGNINRENKIELRNLELLLAEELKLNGANEDKKNKGRKNAHTQRLKDEIDLRDKIRQLAIDDTKNEEQRAIEQVRFDNERAKREIDKLTVDENLKGQARIDAIKRLEAQKATLQIALDKDLFNREEAIRVKFQQETNDKIKADYEKTAAARVDILNEDMDFELYLLESKYDKEYDLGAKANIDNLKLLNDRIKAKKIAILQEKALQDEVGKNAVERLAIENKLAHDIEKLNLESNQKIADQEKQINKQRKEAYISYLAEILHAIIDATQKIIALKIKEVDAQISQQEKRVNAAKDIADRGNAELLQLEQDRLDALTKKREKYVRDQQGLAAIELVANTAIAVSKAAAQGGVAAGVTIAAALIALVAGLASARSIASQAAYYEGGYTGDGNPRDESSTMDGKRTSRPYTWHKGEFVMDHKKTRQFRDIFEDIHAGRVNLNEWKEKASQYDNIMNLRTLSMANPYAKAPTINNIVQVRQLESKMDQLNDTMRALRLGLNVDEKGFTQFISGRMKRADFIDKLAR